MRFQAIAKSALKADYVGNDWFDERASSRFATRVVERNDLFGKYMEKAGHSYELMPKPTDQSCTPAQLPVANEYNPKMEVLPTRTTHDRPELAEVVFRRKEVDGTVRKEAHEWLTKVYKSSRGFGLGTFDASLLAITMKTQSARWEIFSQGYISDIISMAHSFIVDLLQKLCPGSVARALMSVLMESLQAKYQNAIDQVHFLLRVERKGTPATLNQHFNNNLEKRYAEK